ncbi:S-layer homology domain-containing protein [Paenibacillus soyae]|uniref:S-layer homology domain-containing protein n=1 Tax=Paenibacillus soyae TaxID=2969249 RepID=A0A9X2MUI2_9BACL|nr:S-layer homology domain-containing protein [Paenibacillus soyae]MCR2806755.1 S-layer homology domain-containing protein [Paenibacillus soyae]
MRKGNIFSLDVSSKQNSQKPKDIRGGEKKVMKKGLSLFVASSMVVSMFAGAAYAADEKQSAGEYLNELGVIQGNGTDLKEDQSWKRQDVVVLLSRLLGEEEVAEDTEKSHEFTDVTNAFYDGFISWAVEEGLVEGKGNGKFGFNAELKNQEFFAIVLRAFGHDTTGEGYAEVPALAVEYGFATEETDMTAVPTRGETYETIVTALETEVPGTGKTLGELLGLVEVEAPAAKATAAGAKKIEVKFNKAVDDTKVAFTVKKGTVTLNVSAKSFSEDKKTATLELSSKISEGEYTVSVTGVEEEALTSTFTAENEKVAKVEFTSENAPLVDGADLDTDKDDLSIPYQVLNQYGENITKFTTLSNNIGTLNPTTGTIEIDGTYRINDVVAVTLVHAETATSAVKTFTVVAEARVAEVEIAGLYNKDNKALDEDTNLTTDAFYLLVNAKDQYGNAVNNATKLTNDLIINETNTTIVDAAAAFTTVDVNGTTKTALRLNNPAAPATNAGQGQSVITLISNTSGKNASFTVTAAEALRSDTINLNNPGVVYVDEDAYVPVEVFDKAGTVITSISSLNSADKGVKITVNGSAISNPFVLKDGVVQIKVPAGQLSTTGLKPIIAMTATNQIKTMNLNVAAKAVPTVVRGLDSDFATARLINAANATINHTNLVIEDQYGRVMSDANVAAWLLANPARKITVTEDQANATVNIPDVAGPPVVAVASFEIKSNGAATPAVVGGSIDFGAAKGSEKLSFTIATENGTLVSSTGETTITVTDGTEYASYSVDAIGTVYDEVAAGKTDAAAYDKVVKVFGVLANGSKVQLAGSEYKVSADSNGAVNSDIADGTLDVSAALTAYGDKTEFVVPVTVLINKTGQKLTQDVTFSKVAPKVASVKFVAGSATPDVNGEAKTTYDFTVGATFNVADLIDSTVYNVVVTDQYGAKVVASTTDASVAFADTTAVNIASLTVTPVAGTISITGNGTVAATVADVQAYDEFDVEILYVGGAKATVRVRGV